MTLEIDVVTHLTGNSGVSDSVSWLRSPILHFDMFLESEKDYISDYMARAFDRHDIGSYVATGCLVSAERIREASNS